MDEYEALEDHPYYSTDMGKEGKMDIKEIEESLLSAKETRYPIKNKVYCDHVGFLLSRIKELEEERKGMVRLTEAQMKKLGWSHT